MLLLQAAGVLHLATFPGVFVSRHTGLLGQAPVAILQCVLFPLAAHWPPASGPLPQLSLTVSAPRWGFDRWQLQSTTMHCHPFSYYCYLSTPPLLLSSVQLGPWAFSDLSLSLYLKSEKTQNQWKGTQTYNTMEQKHRSPRRAEHVAVMGSRPGPR